MDSEKILLAVVAIAIICFTLLIAQCSQRVGTCKQEAIKAGMKSEDIAKACNT